METVNRNSYLLESSVRWLTRIRSLGTRIEYRGLDLIVSLFPGTERIFTERPDRELERKLTKSALDLIDQDAELFAQAKVPFNQALPDRLLTWPVEHALTLIDGVRVYRRRAARNVHDLPDKNRDEDAIETPDYYRRNFHFQTDGYFSEFSARIYDHQVDLLFSGLADAMRRLLVRPIDRLGFGCGRGKRILELGCGNGSTTRLLAAILPEAEIVGLDLSASYLRVARERCKKNPNVQFFRAEAERIPFVDDSFDLVVSAFLFHELPRAVRQKVIAESYRVLRPGAFSMMVDSVQRQDASPFTSTLKDFPKFFHEPFFTDYTQTPMEDLLREAGFQIQETSFGLASKMLAASKAKG